MSIKCRHPGCNLTMNDGPLFRTGHMGKDPEWMCYEHAQTKRQVEEETARLAQLVHDGGKQKGTQ